MTSRNTVLPSNAGSVAPILTALLVVIYGTTMPTPLYGEYKLTYHLADWSITGIYAVYAAGIVLALIFLNGLSDWVGRRGALWVGLMVFIVADLLFITWSSEVGLYVARVVSGVAAGIYVGTATVAAVEVARDSMKAHAATYATAANVLGLGLGPVVSGVIVQFSSRPDISVYLLHIVLIVISAILLAWVPETHHRRRSGGFVLPAMPSNQRVRFTGAALVGLGGLAAFGLLAGLTQAFLKNIAGVESPLATGLAVGLAFIVSGATQLLLKSVPIRRGLTVGSWVLIAGLVALVAAIPLSAVWLYFVGAAICGVGQGLTMSRSVGTVNTITGERERMSVMNMFFAQVYLGAGVPIVILGVAVTYGDFFLSAVVFAIVVAVITVSGLVMAKDRGA